MYSMYSMYVCMYVCMYVPSPYTAMEVLLFDVEKE